MPPKIFQSHYNVSVSSLEQSEANNLSFAERIIYLLQKFFFKYVLRQSID